MKKTILASASILALNLAAPAYAQSVGNPNPASPTCVGAGGNCSDIDQTGNDNAATVVQGPGVESVSDIDQTGDKHVASVRQQHTDPGGQIGFSQAANEAIIDQNGENAYAGVDQSGIESPSDDNDATIVQYSDGTGGAFNVSDRMDELTVTPALDPAVGEFSNAAIVRQTAGRNNTVLIEQGADGAAVSGNLAYVEQIGSFHDAYIEQTGLGNAAIIDESGAPGPAPGTSVNNDAFIVQSGNNNLADIDQEGSDLSSTITQSGDRNEAFVMDQEGSNNTVAITQSGNDNSARVDDQLGSDNFSSIEQTSNWNKALVEQGGSGNDSYITQKGGDSNYAKVSQTGVGGYSDITQDGSNNSATVTQN